MSIIKTVRTSLVILTTCTLFMGCATFKKHNFPEIGVLISPAYDTKKPTTALEFTATSQGRYHQESFRLFYEKQLVEVMWKSGCFDVLNKKNNEKHLDVKINIDRSFHPVVVFAKFLTFITVYIVPSWHTVNLRLDCKVTDADGNQYEYKLEDSVKQVWGLIMIPFAPFFPLSDENEVFNNLYKHLIIMMQKDDLIPRAAGS